MHNARFRLMAGLAGATLCLFAATSYGQNPTPTTTGSAQTPAPTTPTATDQTTPAPADAGTNATVTTSQTDVGTTTTTTRSFPGGMLGILAVAVIVLLLLFGLFRGRDRTIVKETYVAPPAPGNRSVSTGTAADDRMNLNSRAASGPGTNPGGIDDPNARR